MSRRITETSDTAPDFEFGGEFDAVEFISDIEQREAVRTTGPGTVARRTLEALAERRRLDRELSDLDSYEEG
ncbi:MAG: hypothetical protein P8080_08915 [Gammaproteobacteria bacterium]